MYTKFFQTFTLMTALCCIFSGQLRGQVETFQAQHDEFFKCKKKCDDASNDCYLKEQGKGIPGFPNYPEAQKCIYDGINCRALCRNACSNSCDIWFTNEVQKCEERYKSFVEALFHKQQCKDIATKVYKLCIEPCK